jgi:hypothetical protein
MVHAQGMVKSYGKGIGELLKEVFAYMRDGCLNPKARSSRGMDRGSVCQG